MVEEKIIVEWTSALSVGEETIDSQHNTLLAQINKLYNEFMKGEEESAIENALLFLDQYIKNHFSYEEDYMEKNNYPGLEDHKKIHQEFIDSYDKFKIEIAGEKYSYALGIRIQKFLGGWWLDHIAIVDHKYAEYIKEYNGAQK